MRTTPPPLRIALAAAPELLADTLRTLLTDDRTEVSLVLTDVSDRFDVAVLAPDSGVEVDAAVRIVLDDGPGTAGGGTVTGTDRATLHLADLTAVIAFVRELATGSPPVAAHAEG